MRKVLIVLIVFFCVFLAIGCAENKAGTPNGKGTPEKAVTTPEAKNETIKETPIAKITPAGIVTPTGEKATEVQNATDPKNINETQNVTSTPEMKEYTLEELAQYNGKNGKTYVAYQGKVYDVSDSGYLWKNGSHKGCTAGTDVTEKIDRTPHGSQILQYYRVVGTLKK